MTGSERVLRGLIGTDHRPLDRPGILAIGRADSTIPGSEEAPAAPSMAAVHDATARTSATDTILTGAMFPPTPGGQPIQRRRTDPPFAVNLVTEGPRREL